MIDDEKLNTSVEWWEKKRLWFNIAVGLTGVISILAIWPYFFFEEIVGIIIWGIIANIFYSLGILVEILDSYYLNGKGKFYSFRMFFFITGTLAYCFVTFYSVWLHYLFQIMAF